MGRLWSKSPRIVPDDVADFYIASDGYLGDRLKLSRDGTQAIASSEAFGMAGIAYLFENTGAGWAQTGKLEPDFFDLWEETFDGATDKEKFTHEVPTGAISEAANKLTISVVDSVNSEWTTCPIAWRTAHSSGYIQRIKTIINAFSSPSDDFGGGLCAFYEPRQADDRTEAALLELYKDGSDYKVQFWSVDAGVLTDYGDAVTVADPNVTPLELEFIVDTWDGWLFWRYRQGTTEWTTGYDGWDYGSWWGLMRTGLYARNLNAHPEGSISFDEFHNVNDHLVCTPGDVAVEGDTAVVGMLEQSAEPALADTFTADDAVAGFEFGHDVSHIGYYENPVTGDLEATMFVGAPGANGKGAVYVMVMTGGSGAWTQRQKLVGSDSLAGDRFGHSVTSIRLSSNWTETDMAKVFIGAPNHAVGGNANAGAVYYFERQSNGLWTEQVKWTSPTPQVNGYLGQSIVGYWQSSRYLVLAGEPGANEVQYWHKTEAAVPWDINTLTPSDGVGGDNFGTSLAVCGYSRRIICGSPNHAVNAGAVYTYTLNLSGNTWVEAAKIVPGDSAAGDLFGSSVSVDDEMVLLGAPGRDGAKGGVYVYDTDAVYHATVAPDYLVANDGFGASVSVGYVGGHLIIGADGGGAQAGFVSFFKNAERSPDGETDLGKLPLTPGATDSFGKRVSSTDQFFITGCAPDANAAAGEVHMFRVDNLTRGSGWNSSLVRVYRKVGAVWTLDQEIREPLPWGQGKFGGFIDLSEDEQTLIISNQGGVDQCKSAEIYQLTLGEFVHEASVQLGPAESVNSYGGYTALLSTGARPRLDENTAKLMLASPYLNFRGWAEGGASAGITLQELVPNVDCSIAYVSYDIDINVDSTNNPCDLDGGGVSSAPVAYETPLPVGASGSLGARYWAAIDSITSATPEYVHGGLALYNNIASNVLAVEYNRNTQLITVWQTVAGGAKSVLYTSPAQIGDVNTANIELHILYYADTGAFSVQCKVGSATISNVLYSGTLSFAPDTVGIYARIDAGQVTTGQVEFDDVQAETEHDGGVSIWKKTLGVWAESEQVTPPDATGETTGWYTGEAAMTDDGQWLAIEGDGVDTYEDGYIDIYRDTGAGFVFSQRIETPTVDGSTSVGIQNIAFAVSSLGYRVLVISTFAYNGWTSLGNVVSIYEGTPFELGYTASLLADDFGEEVSISANGGVILTAAPWENVNPDDAGALYVIAGVDVYMRLPVAGLYIDEIRGLQHT